MIKKYEALICAIEKGTIAQAAEQLEYTTSGISRMISSVEEELGLTLLIRKKSGVAPTDNCVKLLPHFRNIITAHNDLKQTSEELQGLLTGNITVGTSMEAYINTLSQLVGEFKEMYPGIHVNIIEDYSSPLAEMIQSGKVDFCIMSKRPGAFQWKKLKSDPLVVITPTNHRFTNMQSVPLDELRNEIFIEIQTEIETDNSIMFKQNRTELPKSLSCSNNFAAACMIEAGLGITIENNVNASVWNKNIASVPLDPPQHVDIIVAYPENSSLTPAAKKFVDFALEKIK